MLIVPIVSGSQRRPWPLGTIVASARTMPPAARLAHDLAFESRGRRKKPWLELATPPPGAALHEVWQLHRQQVHAAIAKLLGKRIGGTFAASLTIDLGMDMSGLASPYLFIATTRFRGPYKWEDRIDVAAVPCKADVAKYFTQPVCPEVARWAFDRWAPHATYRKVIDKWGSEDQFERWGQMRPIR